MSSTSAPSARASRRAVPFRLKAPVVPEHPLQKQLCDVLRLEIAPPGKVSKFGVVWWAVDHANYAGEVPGIRVGRGIIAGVSDLYILYRGMAHHPEIKTVDGVLSDAQQAVAAAVILAGGKVAVVTDAAMLIEAIDAWGIPRARRIRSVSP
jgi:hypothetical protein